MRRFLLKLIATSKVISATIKPQVMPLLLHKSPTFGSNLVTAVFLLVISWFAFGHPITGEITTKIPPILGTELDGGTALYRPTFVSISETKFSG